MRPYRLRTDLTRATIGDFALPLGIVPTQLQPPTQGYTVTYTAGEDELPDSYSFHVVVSHERVRPIVRRAFELLPPQVYAIVEIGSRDAYRSTDVYLSDQPLDRRSFLDVWEVFEDFLLEDGGIGAGANSDDPFVEVFVDQWKGIAIHVPLTQRDEVEQMLNAFGLEEVAQCWGEIDQNGPAGSSSEMRSVLELSDAFSPDVDEVLLELRHAWQLSLDINPEANEDEAGRDLGLTLWHVVVIVQSRTDEQVGAYVSIWLTAGSANEVDAMVEREMARHPKWELVDVYSLDRIAFDDRPDELAALPPRPDQREVHMVEFEPWESTPAAEA